jgi:hypothetical protein
LYQLGAAVGEGSLFGNVGLLADDGTDVEALICFKMSIRVWRETILSIASPIEHTLEGGSRKL